MLTRVIGDARRYGFAVGRIRVLETRLLTRTTYERLLDARDFDRQRRILADTVYAGYLEGARTPDDVERGLDASLADLYEDFLGHANLPAPIVAYFHVRHDFENLKAHLKAEALGVSPEGFVTPLGSVAPEVFGGPAKGFPPHAREAEPRVRAACAGEDGSLVPGAIEAAVDREMFRALLEVADASRSEFVRRLVSLEADAGNARAFVRCRARGAPVGEFESALVPGGAMSASAFIAAYRVPFEDGVKRLAAQRPLRGADAEALRDPARFDVAIEWIVADEARKGRAVAIGADTVVGYVLARRAEVAALRAVFFGTFARVPPERLRERLRDVV
ncbi:MAG TPA: V-type ATPase subunit [Coriobacteriia bacterium]|nr:V-type ATPase subunit [Coriobacteriia bacterium]